MAGLVAGSLTLAIAGAASAQELRLLMIEQVGCYICAAFNRDVAPAYEASPEARVAPLVHADLRGPLPEGVTLASRPYVTPTFILIGPDGAEVDRLTGFPGQDFFWPYVNEMIDRARSLPSG
ncbi:MAG: SoxS protein [Rhodobacteraceae bacterium]|nr:SoxS protein [Paracoccaceae bacterium]